MSASLFFGKIAEFLDIEKSMPKILFILPQDPLKKQSVESRTVVGHQEDQLNLVFTAKNFFPNTVMTNIKIFLLFDFSDSSIAVSKVGEEERFNVSNRSSPLTFEIDRLGPGQEKDLEILIHAPAGTNAPKIGDYKIGITGTFDLTQVVDLSGIGPNPPKLVGGILEFIVEPD
jgi:hypothetical protein